MTIAADILKAAWFGPVGDQSEDEHEGADMVWDRELAGNDGDNADLPSFTVFD